MNSKVKIQTNKAKLDVCLRQSLVLRLNLDVSLASLSWPLFIGGQVSRIRSGSIQTCRIWRFTYQFPYSNTIHFDFYPGPIFIWAFTRIHLRGINIMGLGSHTLVRRYILSILGQDESVELKFATFGPTRWEMGPTTWAKFLATWWGLFNLSWCSPLTSSPVLLFPKK
jgi:hypothetical protein